MKKFLFGVLCLIILISTTFTPAVLAEEIIPEIDGESAIMVDMQNSMVLYEKDSNLTIQPAGFTKIVSAIVVMENCQDLTKIVTASPEVIAECDFTYGNMGVLGGEELSIQALLEGMLIYDAAEAAQVLAEYTFGDYNKFIDEMNKLAAKVGADNTHFKNAGGYYNPEQRTTVADMVLIVNYAMKNPKFAEIVKKDVLEIPATNKYKEKRYLSNTNMFVGRARSVDFYTDKAFGVKTSNMKNEGYGICLAFENGKGKFLCIVANGTNAKTAHTDAEKLRQYASSGFTAVKVAGKGEVIDEVSVPNGKISHILLKTEAELSIRVPLGYDNKDITKTITKSDSLKAPITKGTILGKMDVYYKGKFVGSVNLIANDNVERSTGKSIRIFIHNVVTSPLFYIPVGAIVIFIAFVVLKTIYIYKHRNKK